MEKLCKVLWNVGGCFVIVGFAICKLIGELFSLIGLAFSTVGYYLNLCASKLRDLADNLFDKDPAKKETEEVSEEFSWIAES